MFLKIITALSLIFASSVFAKEKCYTTSHIHAGLGNQLFQIAIAVSYARDHDCDVRFPELKKIIKDNPDRRFIFHRLNYSKFPKDIEFKSYHEKNSSYSPVSKNKKNLCFNGYFQSEKYFYNHRDYVKSLFAPTDEIIRRIKDKYGAVLEQTTVGVHFRTFIKDGNNPEAQGNWGCFNWNYFIKAIECFSEDCLFVVFSDNIEWVKNHLPPINRNFIFVENNPDYIDLYFMSLCHHQIVSPRSSFSWWAAYLNQNPNKIVIVPQNWTLNADGIPENWIRLSYQE